MSVFDGLWIPGYGVVRERHGPEPVRKPKVKGYYVSWDDGSYGGSTGKWHGTLEEAEETFLAHRQKGSQRWYKLKGATHDRR